MTSSRRAPRASAVALPTLLFVLGLSGAAHAQRTAQDIASARQLYNDGIELRDKGDMKGALEKFKAAHALGNTPLTGIELCRAHSALSQPVEAREVCLGVGRIAPLPEESQRSKDARNDAARLAEAEKTKIGSIRIKVTGVPAGWQPTVVVDGATVPAAALNEPRSVNPGVHTITAKVGSGPETRATLETHVGETKDLELGVQPPPENEKPEPVTGAGSQPQPREKKKSNTFATVSFAVAGVSAVIGTIAGLSAISGEGDLDKECGSKICGRDQWDALDSARTAGNVSTVFFVVAGVAGITGLVSTIASGSSKSGSLPPQTAKAPVSSSSSSSKSSSSSTIKVTPVFGLGGAGLNGSF
ncbi:MAG: hypothetical protein BGO98_21660 [Myxococcales bacterium 68-20]|nr:hypothetical protein [Myxococcales bacterium]OJY28155.1 MAG: hypothetical protein BGO98_21660 [Myxococcales bacterium 68-20]